MRQHRGLVRCRREHNGRLMNPSQTYPQIIVAAESRDFRRRALETIRVDDFFLEIGCSFGECTKLLGEQGCRGLALDHSAQTVELARQAVTAYPDISVIQIDARDMADIHRLCPEPSVILFDIGGNETLDKVISMLRLILKTFRPRVLLVRSMELAELSFLIQDIYLPDRPHLLDAFAESGAPLQLLELSRSPVVKDRLYAIQRFRRAIEQPEVLKRLEEMRGDESPTVRKQAKHALEGKRNPPP